MLRLASNFADTGTKLHGKANRRLSASSRAYDHACMVAALGALSNSNL